MPVKKSFKKDKIIHIIGVPMDLGAGRRGVDMGPSALRIAGIGDRLRDVGYRVIDGGDITIKTQEEQKIKDPRLKYLPEITRAVTVLAHKVSSSMDEGRFPLDVLHRILLCDRRTIMRGGRRGKHGVAVPCLTFPRPGRDASGFERSVSRERHGEPTG